MFRICFLIFKYLLKMSNALIMTFNNKNIFKKHDSHLKHDTKTNGWTDQQKNITIR